ADRALENETRGTSLMSHQTPGPYPPAANPRDAPARRRPGALLTALATLPLWLGIGCSGGGTPAPKVQNEAEIATLRQQLLQARQRAVMAEVEAERLSSEIEQLKRQLTFARERATLAPAAQPSRPVTDGVETIDLSGQIEEVELEDPPAPAPQPIDGEALPAAAAAASAPRPADGDTQSIYDRAYGLFHDKRYAEAESEFAAFLERSPQSHLADNAQFWIGECRFARGDFSSALQAFGATVDRYPHGNKVADALLKAGKSLVALGQKQQAISTYEELVTRFPDSAAALAGERLLAELRR
ncbi:MAG: tol-pal system protein YbgF, partial [Acidobacteriota bacterium]